MDYLIVAKTKYIEIESIKYEVFRQRQKYNKSKDAIYKCIKKQCQFCREEFISRIYANRKYCSLSCAGKVNGKHNNKNTKADGTKEQKQFAHYCIKNLVRSKRITPPKQCSACNTINFSLFAHHPDYEKPYQVMWLCNSCHVKLGLEYNIKGILIEYLVKL